MRMQKLVQYMLTTQPNDTGHRLALYIFSSKCLSNIMQNREDLIGLHGAYIYLS